MNLSNEQFLEIILKKRTDPYYAIRVKESLKIRIHSTPTPVLINELLSARYPGEPHDIRNYKIQNWKPITRTYFSKVVKTLSKIQKAEDFEIFYNNAQIKNYLLFNYPKHKNFWNWAFEIGITALLQEPNGLVVVFPSLINLYADKIEVDPSLNTPVAKVFPPEKILWLEETFCVVELQPHRVLYIDNTAIKLLIVEEQKQISLKGYNVEEITLFSYSLQNPPCFLIGGNILSIQEENLYESIISGVCPFWEQALLDFSELTAGIKQHVFPDKWRYLTGVCKACQGTGKIAFETSKGKVYDSCKACQGTGDPPTGMFAEILIYPPTGLQEKPPIPPLGYVKKDFEPIDFLQRNYKDMLREGLRAINLEFLFDIPLNESGRAKEIDRQELNAFLYNFALIFINRFVQNILFYICRFFYIDLPEETIASSIMPTVVIPTQFDFLLTDGVGMFQQVKNAKFSAPMIAEVEKRYINNKFENFNYEKTFLLLCNELDPLRGYSVDEKIELFNANAITLEDFIISNNIQKFITKALEENYGLSFANWSYQEKTQYLKQEAQKVIKELAEEKIKETNNDNSYAVFTNTPLYQNVEQTNGYVSPSNR